VLIYLLLADHKVEIVADRGINAAVGHDTWAAICAAMEAEFRNGNFEGGVIAGVQSITRHLAKHFPPDGVGANELPDKPVML
jgi:uncharacterized membrane protein